MKVKVNIYIKQQIVIQVIYLFVQNVGRIQSIEGQY